MSSSTKAKLIFSVPPPDGERAYHHTDRDPVTGENERNYGSEEKEVVVENLRGKEDSTTLDTAGFQLFHGPAKHTSFATDEDIYREYYPESIELLKELTGASRVVLFDHSKHTCTQTLLHLLTHSSTNLAVRRRRPDQIGDSPQTRQPVAGVHVDQTLKSSIARVRRHLPESDVPALLQRRFQIINLWRPISHPALDWPLGLCDYRSVDPKTDTFPLALIYPNSDYEGETMAVSYNEKQKWKYFRGVTPEEFILIKW